MSETKPNTYYQKLLDDREALAAHLKEQGYKRKLLVAFAFRNALRVLPVLGKQGEFTFWQAEDRNKHSQAIFRALEFSHGYFIVKKERGSAYTAYAAYAAADAATHYAAVAAVAAAAADAASSAYDAPPSAYTAVYTSGDYTYTSATPSASAYAAAAAADASSAYDDARAVMADDLAALANTTITAAQLLARPLWLTLPEGWANLEAKFAQALTQALGETEGLTYYQQYQKWATPKALTTSITLTPSNPDKPSQNDALGRAPLVNALAAFCDHKDHTHPSIIALLGDWGAGKSSVIQQLKLQLGLEQDNDKALDTTQHVHEFLYAELNAWEYENTNNMDAALAQEVVKGALHHYPNGKKKLRNIFYRILLMLRFNGIEQRAALIKLSVGLISAAGLLYWIITTLNTTAKNIPEGMEMLIAGSGSITIAVIIWQLWTKGAQFLQHPLSTKLFTFFDQPSYAEHLGYLPSMRQQLHTLLGLRMRRKITNPETKWECCVKQMQKFCVKILRRKPKPDHRLLLVVDDLDRCKPKAINDTLDAMRLLLGENVENVIVLVAIDYRIALNAVAQRFKEDKETVEQSRTPQQIARDYLAKVVQSSVQLDKPSLESVSGFVGNNLFNDPVPIAQTNNNADTVDSNQSSTTGSEEGASTGDKEEAVPVDSPPESASENTGAKTDNNVVYQPLNNTDAEQGLFKALAKHYDFTNPRQLIRLRNAFQLFRHVYIAQDNIQPAEREHNGVIVWIVEFEAVSQPILNMLFWVEYLHTLSVSERAGLDKTLGDKPTGWEKEGKPWPEANGLYPKDADTNYAAWFKRVEAFVLPAADTEYKAPEPTQPQTAE